MRCFFDSNILIYTAGSDVAKADRAHPLLEAGGFISVQVLNEVANVARRKMKYDWERTRALLRVLRSLVEVVDLTAEVHEQGILLAERYSLSVYDGVIVAAALSAECDTLYSEDMHAGLVVDGRLTISNPFA